MSDSPRSRFTAFAGHRLLTAGTLPDVAAALKSVAERETTESLLAFDLSTGRVVDVSLQGEVEDVRREAAALEAHLAGGGPEEHVPTAENRGRGRPRLGVVAREVTLMPRHWAWLAAQPGGASATLRRLVEQARRSGEGSADRVRRSQDAAFRFMSALGGDLPGYEEALRALFAPNAARFQSQIAGWPDDIRKVATDLAADALAP